MAQSRPACDFLWRLRAAVCAMRSPSCSHYTMRSNRAVLCLFALLAGCGGDDAVSNAPSNDMPAIRVRERRLIDERGREWQLRGINARIEGLFDVTFDDGR